MSRRKGQKEENTHLGSTANSAAAGEPALIFSILTGNFCLIRLLKTSSTKLMVAVVLIDPEAACERETLKPACRRAEAMSLIGGQVQWKRPEMKDGSK